MLCVDAVLTIVLLFRLGHFCKYISSSLSGPRLFGCCQIGNGEVQGEGVAKIAVRLLRC